jgi:hypothetical protein
MVNKKRSAHTAALAVFHAFKRSGMAVQVQARLQGEANRAMKR